MLKKSVLVFILGLAIAGSLFSAELSRHQRGDMYVGLNLGMGVSPNLFSAISVENSFPKGNYAAIFNLGISYDYYQTEWLSLSAGLSPLFGMYAFLDQDLALRPNGNFFDIASMPLSLAIPLSAHINIPYVSFLYAGIGVSLNIPVLSVLGGGESDGMRQPGMTGYAFLGLPIDIGFDLMPEGSGGMRFFFRITPEFHRSGTVVPIGFVWQVFNLKIR